MMISKKQETWCLLLIMPPFFSFIFTLVQFIKLRTKDALWQFCLFFTLMMLYWYPTYDVNLRYYSITSHLREIENFLDGDPLSNFARLFNDYIDVYYFIFVYMFLTAFLYYKSISDCYPKSISIFAVILIVFGMTSGNWANLTYFTFAVTFSLYFFERYKNKYFYYIPLIFITYMLHPGMCLVVVPAIILYLLLEKNYIRVSIIYLISYFFALQYLLSGTDILNNLFISNEFVDSNIDNFSNYTSDSSVWGSAGRDFGLKGTCWNVMKWMFYLLCLFFCTKYFLNLRHKFCFSIFLISLINVFQFNNFYTFNERFSLSAFISGMLLLANLDSNFILAQRLKFIFSFFIITTFGLSLVLFVQPRNELFNNGEEGYDVTITTLYTPSFISIFDIHDFCYSDEYMRKYSINRHRGIY